MGELLVVPSVATRPYTSSVGKIFVADTPSCYSTHSLFEYDTGAGDDFLLHSVEPTLIELRERGLYLALTSTLQELTTSLLVAPLFPMNDTANW